MGNCFATSSDGRDIYSDSYSDTSPGVGDQRCLAVDETSKTKQTGQTKREQEVSKIEVRIPTAVADAANASMTEGEAKQIRDLIVLFEECESRKTSLGQRISRCATIYATFESFDIRRLSSESFETSLRSTFDAHWENNGMRLSYTFAPANRLLRMVLHFANCNWKRPGGGDANKADPETSAGSEAGADAVEQKYPPINEISKIRRENEISKTNVPVPVPSAAVVDAAITESEKTRIRHLLRLVVDCQTLKLSRGQSLTRSVTLGVVFDSFDVRRLSSESFENSVRSEFGTYWGNLRLSYKFEPSERILQMVLNLSNCGGKRCDMDGHIVQ